MNHISQKDAQTTKDVLKSVVLPNIDPYSSDYTLVNTIVEYMQSIIDAHKAYDPGFVASNAYDRAMKGIK